MTLSGSAWYFNETAEAYAAQYDAQSPGGYALRARRQRVLELLDQSGGRVLDVGCGPGALVGELLDLGYEFWGVDAAPRMIEQCCRQFDGTGRAHFAVGEAAHLAFPDGFFDVVICTGVLDRVEASEPAINEMLRVTRESGTLLVSFPNLLSPYAVWRGLVFYPFVALVRPIYHRLTGRPRSQALYRCPERLWFSSSLPSLAGIHTVGASAELVARYGAEVADAAYFYYNVFLSPLDELFPRCALAAAERLERLRFGRLKWLGSGFILKVKKRR